MGMEPFDTTKAQQVWQRVQNRDASPLRRDPAESLRLCMAQQGRYFHLAQISPGRYRERFREYGRQSRQWGNCLRGIYRMADLHPRNAPEDFHSSGVLRQMLEQAIQSERRLTAEFSGLIGDGEWGRVYALLAQQSVARCLGLLEILGAME